MIEIDSIRRLMLLIAACVWLVCAGCASPVRLDECHWFDTDVEPASSVPIDDARWEVLKKEVRRGDIVLLMRNNPFSIIERASIKQHNFYTHSGTIDVRNGEPVVSHAIAEFKLFADSPRLFEKIIGYVQPIPLRQIIPEYHDLLIIRFPDRDKNLAMAEITKEYEASRIPFDTAFDIDDPSRLHCSEYTLLLLERAGYESLPQPAPLTDNRSILELMQRLDLRYTRLISLDPLIDMNGVQIVARLSRYDMPAVSAAVGDALKIIHDAVQADSDMRMGDVIGFNAEKLIHYTQAGDLYFRAVEGMARSSPTIDAAEIRRRNLVIYDETIRPLLTGG